MLIVYVPRASLYDYFCRVIIYVFTDLFKKRDSMTILIISRWEV